MFYTYSGLQAVENFFYGTLLRLRFGQTELNLGLRMQTSYSLHSSCTAMLWFDCAASIQLRNMEFFRFCLTMQILAVLCLHGSLTTWFNLVVPFCHLVLNHSSNNTVFCLHGCFYKVSKNSVSRGLPVFLYKIHHHKWQTRGSAGGSQNKFKDYLSRTLKSRTNLIKHCNLLDSPVK